MTVFFADLVAGGDAAVDAVGAELVEGLGDRQRLGPAADALAADVVADQRAELGRGLAEEAVEGGEADRLLVALDDDRALAVLAASRPSPGATQASASSSVNSSPLLHQRLRSPPGC